MLFAFINSKLHLKVNSSVGFVEVPNRSILDVSYPSSILRRGRLQGGGNVSPTLTSGGGGQLIVIEYEAL